MFGPRGETCLIIVKFLFLLDIVYLLLLLLILVFVDCERIKVLLKSYVILYCHLCIRSIGF